MTPVKEMQRAPEPLAMTDKELAAEIRVSVSWLQHDRISARHIPFYRLGGHIRYNRARVLEALSRLEEGGGGKRRASAAA